MNLADLPDVIFVTKDPKEIELNILKAWESAGGEAIAAADPRRLFFLTVADIIARLGASIDYAAKMNLLAYAKDNFLDHLGAPVDTERLPASAALATQRFILSAPQASPLVIKQGIRVTKNGTNIYFQTLEPYTIPAGQTQADIVVECLQVGTVGNGYLAGELDTLVDPIAFVKSVTNIEETAGGAEIEDDDSYRERIREAPEGFSTAGPEGAYIIYAKSAGSGIVDVAVSSPAPAEVLLTILLRGGQIPNQAILDKVLAKVNNKTTRPLTDKVTASVPEIVGFDINVTWWLHTDNLLFKETIEKKVQAALDEFVLWQKTKQGRDINPSELNARLKNAGAKRVEIPSPIYQKLTKHQLAVANTITLTYGGAEDG